MDTHIRGILDFELILWAFKWSSGTYGGSVWDDYASNEAAARAYCESNGWKYEGGGWVKVRLS